MPSAIWDGSSSSFPDFFSQQTGSEFPSFEGPTGFDSLAGLEGGDDPQPPEDSDYYLFGLKYDSAEKAWAAYNALGKGSIDEHLDQRPNRGACIYYFDSASNKTRLIVKCGSYVCQYLVMNPTSFNRWAVRIVEISKEYNWVGFNMSVPEIVEALSTAAGVCKFYKDSGLDQSPASSVGKEGAKSEFVQQMNRYCLDANDPLTQTNLALLANVVSKVQPDALQIVNYAYARETDPYNYEWAPLGMYVKEDKKFTAGELREIADQLARLSKKLSAFQECKFENAKEIIQFANRYLISGGDKYTYFNAYPFYHIKPQFRICLLRKLAVSRNFTRIESIAATEATAGEMIFQLLAKCMPEDEPAFADLLLADTALAFDLVANVHPEMLPLVSQLIGVRKLNNLAQSGRWEIEHAQYVAKGNFIMYGQSYSEFDVNARTKKLSLVNKGLIDPDHEVWESLDSQNRGIIQMPTISEETQEENRRYLAAAASFKTEFDALEMLSFYPEEEIESGLLEATTNNPILKPGDIAYLPACVIYAIHMERVRRRNAYLKLVVISLVGLAISAGAFALVIEAAVAVDIFIFAFETTLDVSVIVVNNPAVARSHPKLAEAVNYLAFFYGFSRMTFAVGNGLNSGVNRLFFKALKEENLVAKLDRNKITWTNKAGTEIVIEGQHPNDIPKKIASDLTKEGGAQMNAEVAQEVMQYTTVEGVSTKVIDKNNPGKNMGDMDCHTATELFECQTTIHSPKLSMNGKLVRQIAKYTDVNHVDYINYSKRRVFLVVKNVKDGIDEYSEIFRYVESKGIRVIFGIHNVKHIYIKRIY